MHDDGGEHLEMIPKVIHYCWFGKNPKSDLINRCIESWRKYCPEYQIIEWNESNFDVTCNAYVKAAYEDKKWAFVSDYARLYVVYHWGGIYLDTDVLLHRTIDELLVHPCWLASDDVRYIATGLGFGAEKGNWLIKAMMDAYEQYQYPSGTNVIRDTLVVEKELMHWKKSDRSQIIQDVLLIGLIDYGRYATHLYTYTWADEDTKAKRELEILSDKKNTVSSRTLWKIKTMMRSPRLISFFDQRKGTRIEKVYTFLAYDLLDCGLLYFIKRFIKKARK